MKILRLSIEKFSQKVYWPFRKTRAAVRAVSSLFFVQALSSSSYIIMARYMKTAQVSKPGLRNQTLMRAFQRFSSSLSIFLVFYKKQKQVIDPARLGLQIHYLRHHSNRRCHSEDPRSKLDIFVWYLTHETQLKVWNTKGTIKTRNGFRTERRRFPARSEASPRGAHPRRVGGA